MCACMHKHTHIHAHMHKQQYFILLKTVTKPTLNYTLRYVEREVNTGSDTASWNAFTHRVAQSDLNYTVVTSTAGVIEMTFGN